MRARRLMAGLGAMALTGAIATIGLGGAAGAGGQGVAPVTIEKDAVGAAPGTVFTIQLACTATTIVPPGGGSSVASLDFTFTVDESGTAVPDGVNTVGFNGENDCTVTETNTGGAATTSYACEDNGATLEPPAQFCESAGPQADPIGFAVQQEVQQVFVTVTNTFAAPAPVVELQPTFTG